MPCKVVVFFCLRAEFIYICICVRWGREGARVCFFESIFIMSSHEEVIGALALPARDSSIHLRDNGEGFGAVEHEQKG